MRLDLTQSEKQKAYQNGYILVEPRQKTLTFKLLGLHFSSNINRNRPYSFKSRWINTHNKSSYHKWKMIFRGNAHIIKGD